MPCKASIASLEDANGDGIHRRQVIGEYIPGIPLVVRGEDLPGIRADINASGIEPVGGHAFAIGADEGMFLRQACGQRFPRSSAIIRHEQDRRIGAWVTGPKMHDDETSLATTEAGLPPGSSERRPILTEPDQMVRPPSIETIAPVM